MDFRRDRKHFLKFKEILQTKKYSQALNNHNFILKRKKELLTVRFFYTLSFSPPMKNMTYSTFIMSFLSVADYCNMVCKPLLYVQVLRSVLGLQNAPDSHWLLKRINGHLCTGVSAFRFSIISVLRPGVLAITTTHCTVDHHMSVAWRITAK